MNATAAKLQNMFVPDPSDTKALREAFSSFATGVTVVTCQSDQGPMCITANSFSSLSLDPALVMWSVGTASKRYPHFRKASGYTIHVLSAEQGDLCNACARDAHALRDIPHDISPEGVPLLDGCLAEFHCEPSAYHDGGDHVIFVGKVLRAAAREGDALTFFAGKFGQAARS